mmetsp:Transcript_23921/g.34188  ORF Transcript_23921/g.34188 Transcript_23921/m.34188 type:complete len:811 (-) Transcript_23921:1017-3449(-)|eukprot:CAMPEP_0201695348 /NCGR_PEP_ID=MMETSP0578-20130828/7338_1 /ASSEMBLY_ACC=CAM_ASM_000663 /TAXON_ID=267565 /ORGANISM="Skeletonema grethea, Strain CCMP 1804" /LENGTH=810 /DNA_ID=CAMNT_0048181191 /DNA_START=134 /DNA_END=2566 /DNA_ORIENTATION=-
MNESSGGLSVTASASRQGNNDDAMNGTASATAAEMSSENRGPKADNRLSSVADVEDNIEYRRSSSSTRKSSMSWPERTPDPLGPVARYSAAYSVEEIDLLSTSERELNMSMTQDADQSMLADIAGNEGEGGLVLQQHHQALLYDSPRITSMKSTIPSSYNPTSKKGEERLLNQPPAAPVTIQSPASSSTRLQYRNGRRRSSFNLGDKDATILFVDLEGYSKTTNLTQRHITRAFMNTLSNLLTFCYGALPSRANVNDYVILPTGDGAAVVVIRPPSRRVLYDTDEKGGGNKRAASQVNGIADRLSEVSIASSGGGKLFGLHCSSCSRISLQTTEETALWIGASLLLWSESIQIGLRVGLNSGELSIVEDPYGDPNVCGDAINMAARIMDTALPGQILASAESVVKKLNLMQLECQNCECCSKCPNMKYEFASQPSEVVVKHGVTTIVQSIRVELYPLPKEPELVGDDTRSEDRPVRDEMMSALKTERFISIGEPIPANPLAEIKANKEKRSFASLSSLQPSSSFTGSFRQQHPRSKSSVLANDAFTLKRSSAGTQNRIEEATTAAATSSSSNASWSRSDLSKHSNSKSPTILERRSTLTSAESTQIVPTPDETPQLPFLIGNHKTPVTKWYMKVKPTEMKADSGRIKPKVLPQELIRRHHKIAFIGIMHDNLSKAFVNILEDDPQHRWDQVFVLFPSDSCLKNTLGQNYSIQPVEKLIENKNACRSNLHQLLSPVVRDLRFLTYDQLMHCGSYWDWCEPGGFIHVSPLTWGANPKTCPAMNYYWNSKVPSPEYRVYRDGLGYLLKVATPF